MGMIRAFAARRILKYLPDTPYLKLLYRVHIGKMLDLKHPKTFNEKLQWLKLHDRKPEYTRMVDKYEVKKFVADRIGEQYIIPALGVWDRFEDIDFDGLPDQFVLKCTHDSGGVIICLDKTKLDQNAARKMITHLLRSNYYYRGREWAYKDIKPRIIAEPLIQGKDNAELIDYKIMCFHGQAKCLFTCTNRHSSGGLKVTFFDPNWKRLPFERHYPADPKPIPKPESLELMLKLAEELSKDMVFARIDFYEIENKPYFGEITLFPGSGIEEFTPEEWDFRLGEWIQLPD